MARVLLGGLRVPFSEQTDLRLFSLISSHHSPHHKDFIQLPVVPTTYFNELCMRSPPPPLPLKLIHAKCTLILINNLREAEL